MSQHARNNPEQYVPHHDYVTPPDYDDDESPRRSKYISCSDRMCGATDCPNCNPGNFRGGVFVEDLKEDENET